MDKEKAIEYAKRCIGFDMIVRKRQFTCEPYFRARRNYIGGNKPIETLEDMCKFGLMQKHLEGETALHIYSLTPEGIEWLSKELSITIIEGRPSWTT